jgi:hypothetical protein
MEVGSRVSFGSDWGDFDGIPLSSSYSILSCILPGIIPAPQALPKRSRPTRMPQVNAAVVGVHNGTLIPTLLLPLQHASYRRSSPILIQGPPDNKGEVSTIPQPPSQPSRSNEKSVTSSFELGLNVENGSTPQPIRQSTFRNIQKMVTIADRDKPRVPPQKLSPLSILSVLSFLTIGLIIRAALLQDGVARVALE